MQNMQLLVNRAHRAGQQSDFRSTTSSADLFLAPDLVKSLLNEHWDHPAFNGALSVHLFICKQHFT